MRVEIDSHSGFCFGVVRAISRAEEALQEQGEVFSLGDIVHNRVEVQRLERLGMHTVTHDQMPELGGRSLFIRAHGEPPSTYRLAEELGIELIDATCPVVAKLQRRVVEAHEKMRQVGGQVVILGKRGHAEVIGLTGQVEAPTLVVETEEDLDQIVFTRPILFPFADHAKHLPVPAPVRPDAQPGHRPCAGLRPRHDLPPGIQSRKSPRGVRRAIRRNYLRLRPQVEQRQGPFRSVSPGQSPQL